MGQKWYDLNKIYELNENVISIQQELQTKVDAFQTIQTTLFNTWFKCGSRVDVNMGEFASEVQNYMDMSSKYQSKLNSIIHEHNDKIGTLSTSITNSNNICNSYFKKVDYILENITEPHLMFVTPSGGWKNTMRDYNMTQIDLTNTDVDSLTEIWDSYYADYLEYCTAKGISPTVDRFNQYMLIHHKEQFDKIINLIACKELNIDINDPNISDSELIIILKDKIPKIGFYENKIEMDLANLLNLYKTLIARKLTAASAASIATGVDSSVIYSNTVYCAYNGNGIGTVSTISVPSMKCMYTKKTQITPHHGVEFQQVDKKETISYDSNAYKTRLDFTNLCSSYGGKISYENSEQVIRTAVDTLKGIDGTEITKSGEINEISNLISFNQGEHLTRDEEKLSKDIEESKRLLGVSKEKIATVFLVSASKVIDALTNGVPIVGNTIAIGIDVIEMSVEQIQVAREYQNQLSELYKLEEEQNLHDILSDNAVTPDGAFIIISDGRVVK